MWNKLLGLIYEENVKVKDKKVREMLLKIPLIDPKI